MPEDGLAPDAGLVDSTCCWPGLRSRPAWKGRFVAVAMRVWTIGHGTRTNEELVATLLQADVATLVDVRRFPGSRRNPQFNKAMLAEDLERAGIAYLHLPDLGGRRSGVPGEDRFACLRVSSFRSYAAWMSSSEWQQAIAQALGLASPCFMCAETLPWRCHRRLIGDWLAARKVEVVHLLAPGSSVEHQPFAEAEIRNGQLYLCGRLVA
jgi:uncharacterized protein (DUF488 family)